MFGSREGFNPEEMANWKAPADDAEKDGKETKPDAPEADFEAEFAALLAAEEAEVTPGSAPDKSALEQAEEGSEGEVRWNEIVVIPENEYRLESARSSGPGGQNVNKTESKAVLRFNVGKSATLSEAEKGLVRAAAGNRLNRADEIVLDYDAERKLQQNKSKVVELLQDIITAALTKKKERKATQVSYSQKQKRLDSKRRESDKKKDRREPRGGW